MSKTVFICICCYIASKDIQEMGRWLCIKCFLCKFQDLALAPSTHIRMDSVVCTCNHSVHSVKQKVELREFRGSWAD